MIYRCEICGTELEEVPTNIDGFGQEYEYCPKCNEENSFDEVQKCLICDEETVKITEEPFCNKCNKDTQIDFKKLMLDNFTKEQIELLNMILEGEYLPQYLGLEEECYI